MKKFQFQFESVLNAKQRQLGLAETKLAHQVRLVRNGEAEERKCQSRLENACAELTKALAGPMNVGKYQQADEMIRALQRERDTVRQHVDALRATWQEMATRCKRLGAEVEGLSTLRGEAKLAHEKGLQRQSQEQIDEFVMRSWAR